MSSLPKIKIAKLVLVFLFILTRLYLPTVGFSEDRMSAETGNHDSATWRLTEELAELWRYARILGYWKEAFPEEELTFAPVYNKNPETRFDNLKKENSKLVIAPFTTITGQIAINRQIKIALILWEVYLVPIDIGLRGEPIDLDNYKYWYSPQDSVIIPSIAGSLGKRFSSETILLDDEPVLTIGGLPEDESAEISTPGDKVADSSHIDSVELRRRWIGGEATKHDGEAHETEILQVNRSSIRDVIRRYPDGVLFYEMLGPLKHLDNTFDNEIRYLKLSHETRSLILNMHPWLSPYRPPRSDLSTLSYKVALFVNEFEDPVFVKNLIRLLTNPPGSFFGRSYLMKNLKPRLTQTISPLLLHESSLKYFNIE